MAARGYAVKKLSKAVYEALRFGASMPWAYWRVVMCERFGWPLEYFDEMEIEDVGQIQAVWQAIEADRAQRNDKASG